jgi:hypothetical protein
VKPKTDHRYFKITVFLTVVCSGLLFSNFETAAQASDRTVVNERGSLEAVFNDGESVWTLSALELPSGAARDIEWRETQLYAPNAALLEISDDGIQRQARSALRVFIGRSDQSYDGLGVIVLRSDGRLQGNWEEGGAQFELQMGLADSGIMTSSRLATSLDVNPFDADQIFVPTQLGQPKTGGSGQRLPFSLAGRAFGKSLRSNRIIEISPSEQGEIHLFRLDAELIAAGFRVELNGEQGDADLYVMDAGDGSPETFRCGPQLEGANEICVIREASGVTDYLVAVHSVSVTSSLNLYVGRIKSLAADEYYGATIAIDTDYEMVQSLGSVEDVQVYIASLFAYLNATYESEIDTRLLIGDQIIPASAAQDPYQSWSGCVDRIYEVSDRFGAIDSIDRALVAHFSPSGQNCGVAWSPGAVPGDDAFEGVLCDSYYGVSVNNVAAMAPGSSTPISSSWDAIVAAHEIGHNFGSPHSHCYGDLNGGGLTQNSSPVDACYTGESGSGNRCATGTAGLPGSGSLAGGSAGQGNGVIMSYCHQRSGGLTNIARTFGRDHQYGVMSSRVADRMTRAISNASAAPNSCISIVNDTDEIRLNVSALGTGTGLVKSDEPGIDCGLDCEQAYDSGLLVTLTATPQEGSFFYGGGGACAGASSTCQVTMTGSKYVTATFTESAGITVLQPDVTVGPLTGSASSNTDFVIEVPANTNGLTVILEQGSGDPDIFVDPSFPPSTNIPGYDPGPYSACSSFTNQQDEYCEIENPEPGNYYIRINGWSAYTGAYLTATLNESFIVTPSASAGGSISPSAPQTVPAGSSTTFTVTPDSGFQIASVSGSCPGSLTDNTYTTAAITQNCTVEAVFEQDTAIPQPPSIASVSAGDGQLTVAFEAGSASPVADSYTATCSSTQSTPSPIEPSQHTQLEGNQRVIFEADRCGVAHAHRRVGRVQTTVPDNTAASDCSLYSTTISSDYSPLLSGDYVIPVFWHVIHTSSGEGYITDATIQQQMQVLNDDFAAIFDTSIQFELAGITRTENSAWFTDSESDEQAYKTALQQDPDRYLNIYTNDASGYLGYAYFPAQSAGSVYDGVVMNHAHVGGRDLPDAYPYDQGRTLVHEVGHYLGLWHTFQGDGGQCANTLTSGDYIQDTWPHSSPDYGVTAASVCGGSSPIDNFMNYSDDRAMDRFSTQQSNRMICSLLNYRADLFTVQSYGSSSTGPASPLIVTGLDNGTTYQCSVTATNSAGTSGTSNLVSGTPTATASSTVSVTSSAGQGGTISPAGTQHVAFGSALIFQLLPSNGYQISGVSGTCPGVVEEDTFTTAEITADCFVNANFEPLPDNTYSVVATSNGAGTISPEGPQTVTAGATVTYQLIPDSGHFIASVGGTCPGERTGNLYVAGPINSDCEVVASFSPISGSNFSVTFSASVGGAITPPGEQTVPASGVASISLSSEPGFTVGQVAGSCPDGSLTGGNYYTTGAITEDCSVLVSFSRAPIANGKITLSSVAFPGLVAAEGAPFWRFDVQPGHQLQGSIDVATENIRATIDVVPLGYTWTWGNRRIDLIEVTRDIPAGTSLRAVPIDLVAPEAPGTYFLHFGFAGEFNSEQVLSASSRQAPLTWHDGNDFHDLLADSVLFGQANGFVPDWPYLGPSGYQDTDVAASSVEIRVIGSYTVIPSAGAGGSISPSTSQTVESGSTVNFTLTPDSGYQISGVGGSCPGTLSGSTFATGAITADCTVVGSFEVIPATTYTVTPFSIGGGQFSPPSPQTVAAGGELTFVASPNAGYLFQRGQTDCPDVSYSGVSEVSYNVSSVVRDCGVYAYFVPVARPSVPAGISWSADDGQITVRIQSPESGGPVESYVLQCVGGSSNHQAVSVGSGLDLSAGGHQISLLGLVNGLEYSCRIKAKNSIGETAFSESFTVTPESITLPGLPLWLLYQATQQP